METEEGDEDRLELRGGARAPLRANATGEEGVDRPDESKVECRENDLMRFPSGDRGVMELDEELQEQKSSDQLCGPWHSARTVPGERSRLGSTPTPVLTLNANLRSEVLP